VATDIIRDAANALVKRCGTRDPFRIAKEIGVKVLFNDNFTALKGMYTIVRRNRFIFLNSNLDEYTQRLVCAHELGHDALHRDFVKAGGWQEFALYDMRLRPEYEANVFAADILLADSEVLSYVSDGYDVQQTAAAMCTDINLMLIKLDSLNRQGYQLRVPYYPRGDFLGRG
jgi:Zn-dependent peptidase ImmA (M78 family)